MPLLYMKLLPDTTLCQDCTIVKEGAVMQNISGLLYYVSITSTSSLEDLFSIPYSSIPINM